MVAGRSNYESWKFRIMHILTEKGLQTAIEKALDKSDTKDEVRHNATFTILTVNVKDSQITHIQGCTIAKEAWDALQVVQQGIGANGRMVLRERLCGQRMVEGDNMAEHLNKFRELVNQIKSHSSNSKGMEDNELVTLLNLSILESYKRIIIALQSLAEEVIFDIFTSQLLQESAPRQVANTRHNG